MDLQKLDEAAVEYRKAIRLEPTNAVMHAALGDLLTAQHKAREAAAEYREAKRLAPHPAPAR